MQHLWGLDLWAELTGPRLPWGRLVTFLGHLPVECAYHRAALGEKLRWGVPEQLLASVVHLIEMQLWGAADPKRRGPAPKPLVTPWTREDQDRMAETVKARLADLAAREAMRGG